MLRYFFRRLLLAVPTLAAIVTLAFFMIRVAPGGPFDAERPLPPEIQANLEAMYHLDKPVIHQYIIYLSHVLRGDLGPSLMYPDRSVGELIAYGFPVSAKLGLAAIALAMVVGCLLGLAAAVKRNRMPDYAVMGVAMTGIAVPNFVMAPLLVLLFALGLGWLPAGGWGDSPKQALLPVITLALPQIAYIARLMRGSMIETLHAPFVRTALAKGLTMRQVVLRHCLKPALMPVASYLGPATAGILTGSVVVERIFAIPGIGRYFVDGALNRDYSLVLGVVMFYGALIVLFNLLVDLTYGVLDPKVRLS